MRYAREHDVDREAATGNWAYVAFEGLRSLRALLPFVRVTMRKIQSGCKNVVDFHVKP